VYIFYSLRIFSVRLELRNLCLESHHILGVPLVSHFLALSSPLPTKPTTLVLNYRACSSLTVKLPLLVLIASPPDCPSFPTRSLSLIKNVIACSLPFSSLLTRLTNSRTHILRGRKGRNRHTLRSERIHEPPEKTCAGMLSS